MIIKSLRRAFLDASSSHADFLPMVFFHRLSIERVDKSGGFRDDVGQRLLRWAHDELSMFLSFDVCENQNHVCVGKWNMFC